MKTLMLTTALAVSLGALASAPANALTVKAPAATPTLTTNVDCRTVERRVSRDGETRITRERICDDDRRDRRSYRDRDERRYVDRRDRRDHDDRPGINLRLGQ